MLRQEVVVVMRSDEVEFFFLFNRLVQLGIRYMKFFFVR